MSFDRMQKRQPKCKAVFLGEGIFTMELVKTYIMYWGLHLV